VKQKFYVLLVLWFSTGQLFAQDFTGTVKKNDSLSAPIYQANVDILEGGKPFKMLKTYFNGTYKFTPAKSQTYKIHITYTGYTDTTFEVSTDKNGALNANNVLVKLKKDGMRLMGVVKSAEEDFPIQGAVVVLKNIITRLESRQTTGIDGAYNFKLDYETNYKFSIDKRSTGIINKYKDTTFYFSTVGFNIPLDYKLNVALDPVLCAQTDVREGYDPTTAKNPKTNPVVTTALTKEKELVPFAETKQPFIAAEKLKIADDKIAQLQAELEKALKEIEALRKRELEAKKTPDLSINTTPASKKRKEDKNLEVGVIKDYIVKPAVENSNTIEEDRLAAEAKVKEMEAKIAVQQKSDLAFAKRAQELANLQKQQEDSLQTAREVAENKKMLEALNGQTNKVKEDSIASVKTQAIEAKKAIETKAKADSIAKIVAMQRAEQVADSLSQIRVQTKAQEKAKTDSLANAKVQLALLELAKTTAAQKLFSESVAAINAAQEKLKAEPALLEKKEKEAQNPALASTKKEEQLNIEKNAQPAPVELPKPDIKEPAITKNKLNINLSAINFDKNSVEIGAKQKAEFKDLLQLIKDNPTKMVALYAIASADENNAKQLSLRRSDSMLRYLIQNGIAIDKVNSMYFGSEKSRNGCVSSMCPEELQQQNRCVAYELLEPSSD
jgi:outer membrane protein OmpA-like peptidoglycan-associated protein